MKVIELENESTLDNCREFVVVGIMVEEPSKAYLHYDESLIFLGAINSPLNFVKLFQQAK